MTDLQALQATLAAEHAAVYGYGIVGAVITGADRDYATSSLSVHIHLRDQLTAIITSRHAKPVASEPAYRLPSAVDSNRSARALAAHLEQGCAGTLWDLIAASAPKSHQRSLAIGWLSDSAVRAAHWGARQALPGQPA